MKSFRMFIEEWKQMPPDFGGDVYHHAQIHGHEVRVVAHPRGPEKELDHDMFYSVNGELDHQSHIPKKHAAAIALHAAKKVHEFAAGKTGLPGVKKPKTVTFSSFRDNQIPHYNKLAQSLATKNKGKRDKGLEDLGMYKVHLHRNMLQRIKDKFKR